MKERSELPHAEPRHDATAPGAGPANPARAMPPSPVVILLLAAGLGGAGWSVARGLDQVSHGRERLARTLLDVTERTGPPIDFALENTKGETVRLSSFGDKTVFLNFWATWCPPCVEELPSLRRLYHQLKDHPDFVFLAVSTDESWDDVKTFFSDDPAPFPVLLDRGGEIARRYGTTKFPETYVIRNGRLVGHIVGPRSWDRWFAEGWLREVLDAS